MKPTQKDYARKLRNNIIHLHQERLFDNQQFTYVPTSLADRYRFYVSLGIFSDKVSKLYLKTAKLFDKIYASKKLTDAIIKGDFSIYDGIIKDIDDYLDNNLVYDNIHLLNEDLCNHYEKYLNRKRTDD